MNSREVIDNLLRKKPSERMGLDDHPWGDTLTKWVGQGYPVDDEDKPIDPIIHFDFDLAGCGWIDSMPIRGFSETIEENDEWKITLNGAGASMKQWKVRSGVPEHIDFRMTSRKIWEKDYRPHLLEVDRERMNIDAIKNNLKKRHEEGRWAFFGGIFVWELMRSSLGDVCMYENMLLDPDWIHDYNRVYTEFFKVHFTELLREAGIPDGIWIYEDLGYKNGLFCSYKTLEELIFPYYKELVKFFHSYDLPVVLHACGGITEAIPLIVDAGFDGLNPMNVTAGCDALKFAREYGDKLAFFGGLDARILESGDRGLIRNKVIEMLEGMKACGGRYAFGSDHSLSTNIDYEDFLYAIEVYKEHMAY